jgi:hypothetical protein
VKKKPARKRAKVPKSSLVADTSEGSSRLRRLNPHAALALDRALEETDAIIEADPSRSLDPSLPVFQVAQQLVLEEHREAFESGDSQALLAAIRICANHDIAMPKWLSAAYIRAYDLVLSCRVGSWDDAFGRPFPKGAHLKKLRQKRQLRFQVGQDVDDLHSKERILDDALFEEVGKKYGLKKTVTSELYYEYKKFMLREDSDMVMATVTKHYDIFPETSENSRLPKRKRRR